MPGTDPGGAPEPPAGLAGPRRQVILLAGPSGSGKSHIAASAGLPVIYLDDFYKSGSDPTCPRDARLGIVDWDDPRSWNGEAALAALVELCTNGSAVVPVYDISADGPSGIRTVTVGDRPFVAEGVFAAELRQPAQDAGILLDAIVVHRDRWKNLVRRTARDFKDKRKPPLMILRRGIGLYQREDEIVARALRAGFRSLGAVQTKQALMARRTDPRAHASP